MTTIPKRPRANKEMILVAAKIVAAKMDEPVSPESIADNYRHQMDGYELAKQLIKYDREDVSRDDMEVLDELEHLVDEAVLAAEIAWFADNNITAPFPVGTAITKGVIAGVSDYGVGKYLVKENGCTEDGSFLIIKFEDALAA